MYWYFPIEELVDDRKKKKKKKEKYRDRREKVNDNAAAEEIPAVIVVENPFGKKWCFCDFWVDCLQSSHSIQKPSKVAQVSAFNP